MFKKGWIFLLAVLFGPLVSGVIAEESSDKTLSPYFFIKSDDPSVDQLPLRSTNANVSIAGVIADVVVTQEYKNEGTRPIEAIYVFPGSTRAAVYGMQMKIGERTIIANIKEREQARADYEAAKQAGKSASLLEQQRPNVFQMNVANIMPGDLIKVELKYTELLIPEDSIYEFVYPTVVGPRYSEKEETGAQDNDKWLKQPYHQEGEAATYESDIKVALHTGVPLQDIASPSHKIDVDKDNRSNATVALHHSETNPGNRDYVLRYRLSGGEIETGVLLYEDPESKESFFLAMVQPPKRVTPDQIPPRDYVFIVDVSGSMHGFPLDISKKLLRNLIGGLRPNDTFNVLLFASSSSVLSSRSLSATQANIQKAITFIDQQRGGGGTRLLPALKRALDLPKEEERARSIVIATDGYVAVEKEAFDLIREKLGEANFFPFGIGSSVNRFLIEGMAHVGEGEPFVILKPDQAEEQAAKFKRYIESPVLTSIEADYEGFRTYDVEPSSIPDLFAERPVVLVGKWKGSAQGSIVIEGLQGRKTFKEELNLKTATKSADLRALRYLWARRRIRLLGDYRQVDPGSSYKEEITELGLRYNLLTDFTSFVAIDSEVRNADGESTTVNQPLPLPAGVPGSAVGAARTHNFAMARGIASAPLKQSMSIEGVKAGEFAVADKLKVLPPVDQEKPREDRDEAVAPLSKDSLASYLASLARGKERFEGCFNKYGPTQRESGLTILFRIVLDRLGRVVNVTLTPPFKLSGDFEQCLVNTAKRQRFKAPAQSAAFLGALNFSTNGELTVTKQKKQK